MNKNLFLILHLYLIILLLSEYKTTASLKIACDAVIKAQALFLSFNKPVTTLKPSFMKPFIYSQCYENDGYTVESIREDELEDVPTKKDFINNIFGKKLKQLLKKNSFIKYSMKRFLEHLASVLFPCGKNDIFGNLHRLSELKNTNFQPEEDPNKLILSFNKAIWYMLTIYENEIKCMQGENQKKIIQEQIRGLIFGNELLWLTIKSNDKIKNILDPYIYPINTEKVLIKIYIFLYEMLEITTDHPDHFLTKFIQLQESKRNFFQYKKVGIEHVREKILLCTADDGMKLVEKFLDNPLESYFLIQGETTKEIVPEESILHVIIPAFKLIKMNLTRIKSEMVAFLLKLCDYLYYPEGKDVVQNVIGTVRTYLKEIEDDLFIVGSCKERKSVSLNNNRFNFEIWKTYDETEKIDPRVRRRVDDDSDKITENCWSISYKDEGIFIYKITELRGLYTDTFEYILFEVEKRRGFIDHNTFLKNYDNFLKETGKAIDFLPSYYRRTLKCYLSSKNCDEYDLIKYIREKLEKEQPN